MACCAFLRLFLRVFVCVCVRVCVRPFLDLVHYSLVVVPCCISLGCTPARCFNIFPVLYPPPESVSHYVMYRLYRIKEAFGKETF